MTKPLVSIITLLSIPIFIASCSKKDKGNEYDKIPAIELNSINSTNIDLSVDTGDWVLKYTFVDGDGNIGIDMTDTAKRVFVKNISKNDSFAFPFPYIPLSARGGKKYLKGSFDVVMKIPVFMLMRETPANRTNDTFVFEMYLMDDDKNKSNIITTPPIYIKN